MGFYKSRQVTAFVSGQEQVWPGAAAGREARAWAGAGASPALLCRVPAGCLLKARASCQQ